MVERHILCMGLGAFTQPIADLALQKSMRVVVIDPDSEGLERLRETLPVQTICASLRAPGVLGAALRDNPVCLLALSDSDETNLVTCRIADQLGFNRLLAVLTDLAYFPFVRGFNVGHAIFPIPLLLNALMPALLLPGSLPQASFALGAIQMRTFCLSKDWDKASTPLAQLNIPTGVCIGCIRRLKDELHPTKESAYTVFIPQGTDQLLPGDEVTCFGQPNAIKRLPAFFDLEAPKVKKVVISGKGQFALELIHFLIVQEISVEYLDEDKAMCAQVVDKFPQCLVTLQSVEQWSDEHMKKRPPHTLFIACHMQFMVNLQHALLAKECGCEVIVSGVTSLREKCQVEQFGMQALPSVEDLVAERILSILLADPQTRYWSLYGDLIVLVEVIISNCSSAVGMPLGAFFTSILKGALVLAIEHKGAVYSPTGESVLFPGDRILLITTSEARKEVLALFS